MVGINLGIVNSEMYFQAGGMQRAQQLPKIRDAEKESMFGYVYAVSGPGKIKTICPFFADGV